jgi:hypothetical protein
LETGTREFEYTLLSGSSALVVPGSGQAQVRAATHNPKYGVNADRDI